MTNADKNNSRRAKLNRIAFVKLAFIALLMFGFGYAMVPIYYKICEVTGINNLLNPDSPPLSSPDLSRTVRVELDANARGLISMRPKTRLINLHPGETYSVIYEIKNLSGRPLSGQAIPSYGPARAGRWFRKLECFCFSQMTLAANETRELPVVFAIDSALPNDIHTISLSYTFFEVEGAS